LLIAVLDLANAQAPTNEIVSTPAERHVELVRSHKELKATEQALYPLISTVDRHITANN